MLYSLIPLVLFITYSYPLERINNKTCPNDFRLKMHEKSSTIYSTIDSTMSNSVMSSTKNDLESISWYCESMNLVLQGSSFPKKGIFEMVYSCPNWNLSPILKKTCLNDFRPWPPRLDLQFCNVWFTTYICTTKHYRKLQVYFLLIQYK